MGYYMLTALTAILPFFLSWALACSLKGLCEGTIRNTYFQTDQSQISPYFSIVVIQCIGFGESVFSLCELLQLGRKGERGDTVQSAFHLHQLESAWVEPLYSQ